MSDYILVLCTTNTEKSAHDIAEMLVSNKFAACVNILNNIESVYKWEGKIVNDKEFLLIIKTTKELYKDVEVNITAIHPYEVPEIISIEIENGLSAYLDWISSSV